MSMPINLTESAKELVSFKTMVLIVGNHLRAQYYVTDCQGNLKKKEFKRLYKPSH